MSYTKLSVLALAISFAQVSSAAPESMSERSEQRFLDIAGASAVSIAPHLYRVEKNSAVHHFAFGHVAIQQLNSMVVADLAVVDQAAAERFSSDLAKFASSTEKLTDATTLALCNANLSADVAAWTAPGFANHSVGAAANLNHNQRSNSGFWGATFATAIACLPTSSGESCDSPYGETVSDGTSATLTPKLGHIGASAEATTTWPSFTFSRLQGYASAVCGPWEGIAAHVCQGDGAFSTCR